MPIWRWHTESPEQEKTESLNDAETSKAHYIGIDVGSASARACVIDEDGELVSFAVQEINT